MNCRTLTAPVDLIKCLRAIKEHAFVASEYPVVITFEDHLNPNLQALVAKVSTTSTWNFIAVINMYNFSTECFIRS